MVNVPLALCATLLSVKLAVLTPPITAASFVPVIVTVMVFVSPVELLMVKLSV